MYAATIGSLACSKKWLWPSCGFILPYGGSASRIQLSREQVIDRLVLKTTGERKSYLDALLQIALARGRPELTFAPLFLTKHHLTQRVALILTEVAMSRTRIATAVAVSCTLLALTGRLATRAFPLESPPIEQVALLPQASRSRRDQYSVVLFVPHLNRSSCSEVGE